MILLVCYIHPKGQKLHLQTGDRGIPHPTQNHQTFGDYRVLRREALMLTTEAADNLLIGFFNQFGLNKKIKMKNIE